LLKASVGLGVSALASSCCCTTPAVYETDWRDGGHQDPFPNEPNSFLKPKSPGEQLITPSRIIDPHCHIYNASDWQIGGALYGPLAHSVESSLTRMLLQVIAYPLEEIVSCLSITAEKELEQVEYLSWIPKNLIEDELKARVSEHRRIIEDALFDLFRQRRAAGIIRQILAQDQTAFTGRIHTEFSREFLSDALDFSAMDIAPLGPGFDCKDPGLGAGLFGFLSQLCSPRWDNLKAYQAGFSPGNEFDIKGCYASLLDFDYWIGRSPHPPSTLRAQMLLMEKISTLSEGYMKPMIAYNPWKDIKEDDASIDLVVDAVCNHGFVGAKIYLQMGYYPLDNASQPAPAGDLPRPSDLGLLDKKLKRFWATCRELDIPVMTHSKNSMGRNRDHNKLGNPDAWERFFRDPTNAGTRVNLAHMGGETGSDSRHDNWTRRFTEIMNLPGATGLYGDFGMWKLLTEGCMTSQSRIRDLLKQPVSNKQTVADRFMFGTDWLMLIGKGAWNGYAQQFLKMLEGRVEEEDLDKIFYKNAEKLFTRDIWGQFT